MKVTKTQARENRAHIVETASTLFRERGYDGVSVADLMAAAGFTQASSMAVAAPAHRAPTMMASCMRLLTSPSLQPLD